MAGHSKWANIRRKKEKVDARKGKVFTKLFREIMVAAKTGGRDPASNPRLRHAIDEAKAENMPKENIEKAIKKGIGELGGENYEECVFEGYGPGGVAVLVSSLTDNRKRTSQEVRHIFSKYGGNLGEAGCVSWMFSRKGYFAFSDDVDFERVFDVAVENGAEDVKESEGGIEVICAPSDFEGLRFSFEEHGLKYETAEVTMVPQSYVKLSGKEAEQMIKLMDALEELEDVQKVYANFDIKVEEMERIAG